MRPSTAQYAQPISCSLMYRLIYCHHVWLVLPVPNSPSHNGATMLLLFGEVAVVVALRMWPQLAVTVLRG